MITITSPVEGATVSGIVTVRVVETPGVSFSIDGIVQSTGVAPTCMFSWNTANYPNGTHAIKVVDGAQSAVVNVTVQNALALPKTLSDSLKAAGTVSGMFAWTIITSGDCARLEFWRDGIMLAGVSGPSPFVYSLDTKVLSNGTHAFGANMVDSTGHKTGDPDFTATISNGVVMHPSISGVAKVGQTLTAVVS